MYNVMVYKHRQDIDDDTKGNIPRLKTVMLVGNATYNTRSNTMHDA